MFENSGQNSKDVKSRQDTAEVYGSAAPWLALHGSVLGRPATYDELVQQQYPNCLRILDNPRISSTRQKALMAEVAYVALQGDEDFTTADLQKLGLRSRGEPLMYALFYIGSAYDRDYRIVPFTSGRVYMPPLIAADHGIDYFPTSRALYSYSFKRSTAFEAVRGRLLNGTLTSEALQTAVGRIRARGNL